MVQSITTGDNIDSLMASVTRTTGQKKTENAQGWTEDTVSIGNQPRAAATYNRSLIAGMDGTDSTTDLKELVQRLLRRQGVTWETAMAGETVEIDDETRTEAKALIAEDGYWGVEKTSERIFQMAIANAGGDIAKVEQIRDAVDNGFKMAEKALGETLPEISRDTYDAVMEKLDGWAEGIIDEGP